MLILKRLFWGIFFYFFCITTSYGYEKPYILQEINGNSCTYTLVTETSIATSSTSSSGGGTTQGSIGGISIINCQIQDTQGIPVYDIKNLQYSLILYGNLTAPDSLKQNYSADIILGVENNNSVHFGGSIRLALHNSANLPVIDIETKSDIELESGDHASGLTFSLDQANIAVGEYQIRVFYKIDGLNNWQELKDADGNIISKSLSIISSGLPTCNEINPQPNPLISGQAGEIQVQIPELGNVQFDGSLKASLFRKESGKLSEDIQERRVSQVAHAPDGRFNFSLDAITSPPGNYSVCISYKTEDEDWVFLNDKTGTPACQDIIVKSPYNYEYPYIIKNGCQYTLYLNEGSSMTINGSLTMTDSFNIPGTIELVVENCVLVTNNRQYKVYDHTQYDTISGSGISLSADTIEQNNSLDVILNTLSNRGTTDFTSSFRAVLNGIDSEYFEAIEIKDNITIPVESEINDLVFHSDAVAANPGKYQISIQYKNASGSWVAVKDNNDKQITALLTVTESFAVMPPICSSIITAPSPLVQNQKAEIQVHISDFGDAGISDIFKAALFKPNGEFAEDIQERIVGQVLHANDGVFSFYSDAVMSEPGDYRLCISYKPKNGNWEVLEDENGNLSCIDVTVSEAVTQPQYQLRLNGNMTIAPNPVEQNQPFDILVNIANNGSADFTGNIQLAVYNSNNEEVTTYIEPKNDLTLPVGSDNSFTFHSEGISASPGDYWIFVQYIPEGAEQDFLKNTEGEMAAEKLTIKSSLITDETDETVFDIVISLYHDPRGVSRTPYEEVIRYWADGIYEQSNGAHKLGKVRIFPNNQQEIIADVLWYKEEHPHAWPSGFGNAGKNIEFGDNMPDYNMLENAEAGGYALAHEWGHYVYGLYDEYARDSDYTDEHMPRSTDTPVIPSIMNYQWSAVGGNYEWLNHSTKNNFQENTAQGRIYEKSSWDFLIQKIISPNGYVKAFSKPKLYPNLIGKEPTAKENWVKIELSTPEGRVAAREKLEIIWMSSDIQNQIQIVIDSSGSMSGDAIENAKAAAQMLIDVLQDGKTDVGVLSFSSSVKQILPMTAIPEQGNDVKNTIKNAIATISSGGGTYMYDGADRALSDLLSYAGDTGTNASQIVFLLSDGKDSGSDETEAGVIQKYQDAGVTLITFGYGNAAPTGTLKKMAESTGSAFYSSPTESQKINQAFLSAIADTSNSLNLASFSLSVLPGSQASETVEIDSTLDSFNIIANYPGTENDISFILKGPNGTDLGIAFNYSSISDSTGASATISPDILSAQGTGAWSVEAVNNTGNEIAVSMDIVANPGAERTYNVVTSSLNGSTVNYPEPIILTSGVSKGAHITGVNLNATMEMPDGTTTPIAMNDNGQDGDAIAQDGIYSAILWYSGDGVYTVYTEVDNSSGNAEYTYNGVLFAPDINGDTPLPVPEPIAENFTRRTVTQITIQGYKDDDHIDELPTPIKPDNKDIPGSVDFAGDTDGFMIRDIDTGKDLVVRVASLALGMEPVLDVYKSDRSTLIASGNMNDAISNNGYLYLTINRDNLDPSGIYAEVRHANSSVDRGTYDLSAGTALVSDIEPETEPTPPGYVNDDNTNIPNPPTVTEKTNDGPGEDDSSCFISTCFFK